MFIYCITNGVNEKAYVGLYRGSKLRNRWTRHLYEALKTKTRMPIHAAMRKHGADKFHITSIWSGHISLKLLGDFERYFIHALQTKSPNGYNLTGGGCGMLGVKQSQEHIKKRLAAKAWYKHHSPETLAKMRGRKMSAENRARLSAMKTGKTSYTPSAEVRKKISDANKGRVFSQEHKAKMRANHVKTITAEHRAKISASLVGNKRARGFHHSPETIDRLREINRRNRLRWLKEHSV